MKRIIATLALCLATAVSAAEPITPEYVAKNYPLLGRSTCSDHETKEEGLCYIFIKDEKTVYMVFVQDGKPVFMREANKDGYHQVWPTYEPAGIQL